MMETQETVKRPALTPKALIHQKYGSKACYKIEEVRQFLDNGCPGLIIQQQAHCLYRCSLDLPGLSVTSDMFIRKKDAEQSAAKIAIEKLGIQSASNNPTSQEAWDELIARISGLFTDEFLSSSHPLVSHLSMAMRRVGDRFGMIPVSAIAACDMKVNNLCKIINPKTESDPLFSMLLIMKAAAMSDSVLVTDGELGIPKRILHSPEVLKPLIDHNSDSMDYTEIEAIRIPCSIEEHVELLTFGVSNETYYMDEIAKKLEVKDSSRVVVSRTVGKASSEMKLYFPAPDVPLFASDSLEDVFSDIELNVNLEPIVNKRASYLSGQKIFGDAVLTNVGYTWKSSNLFCENVSLCTYYRMLLSKVPDGHYKVSREAILAAELPATFTTRSNWRGPYPRDLLCTFCRQHRLSEPLFSVKCVSSSVTPEELLETGNKGESLKLNDVAKRTNGDLNDAVDKGLEKSRTIRCQVKILSRRQDPIIECSFDGIYRKEVDAIQSASLKVLNWLNKYFKQLDMPIEELVSSGLAHNINLYPLNFSCEFASCLSIHGLKSNCLRKGSSLVSTSMDKANKEGEMILSTIEGPDSGTCPSPGSLTCISYAVALVKKGESLREHLESKDEFEFEIGTGSVINQLEACITQLSVNQAARFVIELPSRGLLLAAAGEQTKHLSQLSLNDCFLEYSVKVLCVTEPLEDRMEQALFSPPLSKQRVDFAVRHINGSHATTLVDFGCGSGSLLDSLLEHTTTLEKIVGVDISLKSLTRAAKILHSKLSTNSMKQMNIRSAVLYDGSITEFDSRLYGFDIGTCLEVIEHMEEDQAFLFGDVALSLFCPRILIVSTPNYEYNCILQKSSLSNKDDPEEKSGPCKFRNHDHKFEWTRRQFEDWATDLAARHNYSVEFSGVGGLSDVEPGFASQIAVFRRSASHEAEKSSMIEDVSQPVKEKSSTVEDVSQPFKVIWEWPDR